MGRISVSLAIASVIVLAACDQSGGPQIVHADNARQPWLELRFPRQFCYINVHWPDEAATANMMQLPVAPRHSLEDGRILMIDPVSRDLVVSAERAFGGSCNVDAAVAGAVGVATRLQVSEAARVTEGMWDDARADLICRTKFDVSQDVGNLESAVRHATEQQNGGGMLQYIVNSNTVELELYRNCRLPSDELAARYKTLVEAAAR
jgi:hypothetical protein